MPEAVKTMLEPKGLAEEYEALMNVLCESGVGKTASWGAERVHNIAKVLSPRFEAKGAALVISHKEGWVTEKVDAGPDVDELVVGQRDKYLWIEFVDRTQQPDYEPQYGIHLNASRVGTVQMDQIVLVGKLVLAVASTGQEFVVFRRNRIVVRES